jgi:hypothetical protein
MVENSLRSALMASGLAIAVAATVAAWQPSAEAIHRAPPGLDPHTFSHAELDTVLARYLRDGRVDYAGLSADREPLDRYLQRIAEATPELWPHDEQFAFWVNVYNARVLVHVIDRPGLKSVLDVGKILGIPTMAFFRQKRLTAGKKLSLSQIEHGILRERFGDPRLHFVLNCASASCPELPPQALTGATLEEHLRSATTRFLGDPALNRIEPPSTLKVSEIFKWYRKDFEATSGSVRSFIETHRPGEGDFDADVRIRYLKYDWHLNGSW